MGRVVSYNEEVPGARSAARPSIRYANWSPAQARPSAMNASNCALTSFPRNAQAPSQCLTLPKPAQISAYLDRYVIGQESRRNGHFRWPCTTITSASTWKCASRRESARNGRLDVPPHVPRVCKVAKSNILLLGPTGVGKTYLAQTLAQ